MIHAFLKQDLFHALETLFAVSVLILIVLMMRPTVSRQFGAGIAYLLWAIPIVRFFLPPLPTPVSILNSGATAPEAVAALADTSSQVAVPGARVNATPFEPAPLAITQDAPALPGADDILAGVITAGTTAWIVGTVFLILRGLYGHWRFMRMVNREAIPVSAPMAALVTRIASETGLRRPPRLVAGLISRAPFVTGLLRPVIVIPAWFGDDYTPTEARTALAHELMHVRRGDLWALQVYELFVAAMWFNPLAYIARNAFRTDQEAACDADVLARCQTSPHAYGSTLIKAARLQLPEPAIAAAHLPLTHSLKERLTRMTYPAPSIRRRMIGFGAALLFGASTLAITSSVAAAGEPKESEVKEIRVSRDTLLRINGRSDDRQYILLSDPMSKVLPVPPVPPEVGELEHQMKIDVTDLTGPEMLGPIIGWHESGEFEELSALAEELAGLHLETFEETVSEDGQIRVVKRIGSREMTPEQREALQAKLEAKVAALEAGSAARELQMDAIERKVDHKVIVLEKRIEANGTEIERIIEERFGPEFEARIEAQAKLLEGLMNACEDSELATGETRVIERQDADGEMFRLVCVEGSRDNLSSEEALAVVSNHPGITDAEKAAFESAAKGERRKSVMVFRSGPHDVDLDIEAPEPLAQPARPAEPTPTDRGGE
jgi:beta-lactamase regulating signal transducer with metallopeptidase domain